MSNGSNKKKYLLIGLSVGIILTILKILYFLIPSYYAKIFISIFIDLLFFSYFSAGSAYILYEYFYRKGLGELGLEEIVMIITFILSIGVYSEAKLLFLSSF